MQAIAIFTGAIVVVVACRIPRHLAPTHYFEMSEVVHGMNNAITWQGILLRFACPALVAFLAALVVSENEAAIGAGIGFLSALLLVWPVLLDRRLLPWQVAERGMAVYLLYAMFVASFTLLGLGGGMVGSYAEVQLDELFDSSGAHTIGDALGSHLDDFFVGLAVMAAGGILGWGWKRLDERLRRNDPQDR